MGDGVKEPSEQQNSVTGKSQGEIFHEVFPHYLAMGMNPEQFWDQESRLALDYRKAYKIRIENEKARMEEIHDRAAWLNGIYMRNALQSVYLMVNGFVPKGVKAEEYPDKPYTEKAKEQRNEETRRRKEENEMKLAMAMFQAGIAKFNKRFQQKEESAKPSGG